MRLVFFTQKEDPTMARRRGHTGEQILTALRQARAGRPSRRSVERGDQCANVLYLEAKICGTVVVPGIVQAPCACRGQMPQQRLQKVSNVAALNVVHREWTNVPV